MGKGLRSRLSYVNVVGTLALVLALGGISYAAVSLPKNSAGKKQLQKNAVVGSKVANGKLRAKDVKGKLPPGPAGEQGPEGPIGVPGPPSTATRTVMGGTVTLASANEFFAPNGTSTGTGVETDVTMLSPAVGVTAKNLSIQLDAPPGVGITRRFDLRINNLITTDLECVITHPATSCTSTGTVKDTLVIPPGTRISMSNVSTGAAAPTRAHFGFTIERTP